MELWNEIVGFYKQRLLYYIKCLKSSVRPAHRAFDDFYGTLTRNNNPAGWTVESLSNLIDQAKQLTKQLNNGEKFAPVVWKYIEFIARLRRAHKTFVKCAKYYAPFRRVKIIRVKNDVNSWRPTNLWSLDKLLAKLGLRNDDRTVETYIAKTTPNSKEKHTITWARKTFHYLSTADVFIHAEIRLILFILQSPYSVEEFFGYMGCSKDNCYMCSAFLNSFGGLISRGTHSRVYHRWTIPDTPDLSPESVRRLTGVIKKLDDQLVAEIRTPVAIRNPFYIAQSTIGQPSSGKTTVTSDVTVRPPQLSDHLSRVTRSVQNSRNSG